MVIGMTCLHHCCFLNNSPGVLDRENWLKHRLKLSAVDVANVILTMVTAYENIDPLLKYRTTPVL